MLLVMKISDGSQIVMTGCAMVNDNPFVTIRIKAFEKESN
jgi:hypothetical protein